MNARLIRLLLAVSFASWAFCRTSTIRVAANLVLTPVWVADAEGKAVLPDYFRGSV
jgi:hypothetical protein